MKNLLFLSLFVILPNCSTAQNDTVINLRGEPFGGAHPLVMLDGTFNPFALNYFRMLDYEIQCLGNHFEYYHYTIRINNNYFIFGIDDELKFKYFNAVDIPTENDEANFLGHAVHNEQALFFFELKSAEFPKGHRGLFYLPFDLYDLKFSQPKLVDYFKTNIKLNLELVHSPNKNYLGLIITEDEKKGFKYSYSSVILDNNFDTISVQKNKSGKFEEQHFYLSSSLNNGGDLTIVFAENAGKYSGGGIEKSHNYATFFTHQMDRTITTTNLNLSDRQILDITPIEESNNQNLFVSWFYTDKNSRVGFSLIDKTTFQESKIFEFDYEWLEPFVELEGNNYVDQHIRNNLRSQTILNAHFNLVEIIDNGKNITYVLEKKTKVRFFAADGGMTILAIDNFNTSTTVNGDLLFVHTTLGGTFLDTTKIERTLLHGISSGDVHFLEDRFDYDLVFSSLLPQDPKNTSDRHKGWAENYLFRIAHLNLEGNAIKLEHQLLNQFNSESKKTQYIPYISSIFGETQDFMIAAFTADGWQMIRMVYEK